jgi:aspartyl/glutamyl-tRNA(Asn/Gln) amidotransferase C subunit
MKENIDKEWQVSDEELRKTAELAAIKLDPSDYQVLRQSLEKILEHFAVISRVEYKNSTEGTPVERRVSLKETRDDTSKVSNGKTFIENAPDFEDGFFFIPEIIK